MQLFSTKRATTALVSALIIAGVTWLAWPNPIPVYLAMACRQPMQVTIDDEDKTSVRDIYIV